MKYKKIYSYLLTLLLALSLFPKQLASSASYGFIYGAVTGPVVSGVTITIKGVSPTTGTWTITTNANGTYYSSSSTSNCVLPCPGVYTVTASKPGAACTFSEPITVELKNCCGSANSYYQANFKSTSTEKKNGIITGTVGGAIKAGVTITITALSPATGTWTVTTDANGKYYSSGSTSCILPCPGKYKVTASKTGYTFSAPVTVELKTCCGSGEYGLANFTATAEAKKYGLIYGYVTGAVVAGVTITITAVSPATGTWTVTTDANGKYQSSTSTSINCALPCPGKYKVTASKTGSYAFSEPQLVELTTCCGSGGSQANFTSTSTEKKNGIIYGAVTGAVVAGVTITITGVSPTTGTWTVTTDANGKYYSSSSTACVLPCPGTFKVTASKTGSYAFSAPVTVDLKICCGSGGGSANFTSTSTEKKNGIITGTVGGAIKAGVTVIIEGISPTTGSWTVTTDINGKYYSSGSTSCILPCPGKYKVTASKTGYTFSAPVTVELKTCCGSGEYGLANFTATAEVKKNGIIYGAVTGAVVAGVTITITGVSPTTGTWTVTTDANGKYYSSSSTACVLPCPGTFKVTASKTGSYAFSAPVTVDLKICCGSGGGSANFTSTSTEKKMGVIYGAVSGVCIEGVTIVINGIYPTEGQWVFKTDKYGKYSTVIASNCILPCPGKYVVIASKPDSSCKFSDPVIIELKTCCGSGEYGRADFKSDPVEAKGRMIGNIMGSNSPVTISVIQEGGGQAWLFQTDANGFYDTGCVLPCPGSYIVIPSVPGSDYSFSPPYQNVKLEKCCINGYLRVDFMRTLSTKNHAITQIQNSSDSKAVNNPLIMWYLTNDRKSLIHNPF